ncbi:hypothetical protein [Pseudomonas syringae]|uniref:hypothetical protein n=1 Tax=Pseudomonas syringae TaxID=317 RepID=UPI0003FB0A07|nr:hypothetical protein [Pseudomonas syringae]
MWARIENDTVVELTGINPEGRFHPSLVWMACASDVQNGWVLVNGELKESGERLKQLYTQRVQEIDRDCEAVITAGFWASALGAPHFYSSQVHDQLNLIGMIVHDQDVDYPCRDERLIRAFLPHTRLQLREVGDTFAVFKLQQLRHAHTYKLQLDEALAAADLAAIGAITWKDLQS